MRLRHPTRLVVLLVLPVAAALASSEPEAEERERVDQLTGETRAEEIARLREEEREVRTAWNPEGRHHGQASPERPLRPADLSPEAQDYLSKVLLPMLSNDERAQLRAAEGHW